MYFCFRDLTKNNRPIAFLGRTNDTDRSTGNDSKGGFESKDRNSRDRRGRGRGFGRGGKRGGGPPRRYG